MFDSLISQLIVGGSNTRDGVESSSLPDGQLSCQDIALGKGFNMINKQIKKPELFGLLMHEMSR